MCMDLSPHSASRFPLAYSPSTEQTLASDSLSLFSRDILVLLRLEKAGGEEQLFLFLLSEEKNKCSKRSFAKKKKKTKANLFIYSKLPTPKEKRPFFLPYRFMLRVTTPN